MTGRGPLACCDYREHSRTKAIRDQYFSPLKPTLYWFPERVVGINETPALLTSPRWKRDESQTEQGGLF